MSSGMSGEQNGSQEQSQEITAEKPKTNDIADSLNRLSIQTSPKQPSSPTSPGASRLTRKASSPLINRSDARPPSRRSSSNNFSGQPTARNIYTDLQRRDDPPPLSASTVAETYFKRDLETSISPSSSSIPEATVILHDSCYGHRFSRPKTTKSVLSLIVERPERLQASVLGVATSYVRNGGRHAGSSNPPGPKNPISNPPFRIQRTSRELSITHPTVAAVHGAKWMNELKSMCEAAELKLATGQRELARPDVANGSANQPEKRQLHEGDLYLSRGSLDAFQGALGGVLEGVDTVFQPSNCKRAFVCVRPPGHHCSSDHPSGFCWLNNVHVGIEHAAQTYGLTHAAIIDFDLHHGDGSQAITWERNLKALKNPKPTAKNAPTQARKPFIGYFSLHDVNSYPCEDGDIQKVTNASVCIDNAHGQSIWNIHLQPWKTIDEFWQLYDSRYLVLLEKTRKFLKLHTERIRSTTVGVQPKAAIFLSAGFDASEWEMQSMQRHKVNVPTEFYSRFTKDVVKLAEEEDLAVDGRVISVLEGGYSNKALMSGVLSHITGLVRQKSASTENNTEQSGIAIQPDVEWWSAGTLSELEALLKPPAPVQPPKKAPRGTEAPTYASPTQSFTAKAVDPAKVYRSLSGTSAQTPPKSRPITPPPPDVDWATAAHELSKILIPTDRPTSSCKHEDLNEPKVKRERERHSSIGLPALESGPAPRMQLRGRKPPNGQNGVLSEEPQAMEKDREVSSRRRTISDLASIADETVVESVERPTTSNSDKSIRPPSQARAAPMARPPTKSRQSSVSSVGLNVSKTRRTSVGKANSSKSDSSDKPNLTSGTSTAKAGDTKASRPSTSAGDDVDKLAAGVKKITLHMSNKTNAESDASTKARKPTAPKATKTATTKPATATKTARPIKPAAKVKEVPQKKTAQPAAQTTPNETSVTTANIKSEGTSNMASGVPSSKSNDVDTIMANGSNSQATSAPLEVQAKSYQPTSEVSHTADSRAMGLDGAAGGDTSMDDLQKTESRESNITGANRTGNSSATDAQFVPYQPSGFDKHQSHGQQEPLTWLPPNTGTPEQATQKPGRGKENLPVFTATSPIPFGPSKVKQENSSNVLGEETQKMQSIDGMGLKQETKQSSNVWEVPETPMR